MRLCKAMNVYYEFTRQQRNFEKVLFTFESQQKEGTVEVEIRNKLN